ncbi:MAG: 16S rRNA (adenine(1518)-N(6)/adenine(1519)-N(6))-dimethyltransferase RsmA [bacterium]|nr:16S rRNA (adenine(1518)-N(6)/adenine(1519)-N(6))-dimethyltransferase RsmA [bacterium]
MNRTKKELKEKDLEPIKHFGQNFLVSEEIIERIISEANIKKGEHILEVGPGTGNLTVALLEAGANVVAIEKDENLSSLLDLKIKNEKLKIVEGDILKFDETTIKSPYRVIANIPYYLTGKLIQKFLLSPNKPLELILMVQKEVAERITANPPKANFLSSFVQFMAKTEVLFMVGKDNFWPKPEVDSAIIRIIPQDWPKDIDLGKYIAFLHNAFKQPRQTLFNNLRKTNSAKLETIENIFKQLEFDKKIRAQNLSKEELIELYKLL